MTPKPVRNCIFSRLRWRAFLAPWGKNRAVLFDLGLELFLEPPTHPFAPFGFDFQFHVAQ
jgi:hypothetical protein